MPPEDKPLSYFERGTTVRNHLKTVLACIFERSWNVHDGLMTDAYCTCNVLRC